VTGKQENNKVKKCPLCGGTLQDGVTTATFLAGERVNIIKDVPAEVCSDCEEAYVKSAVVGEIEKILDKLEEYGTEISVVHFKIAS